MSDPDDIDALLASMDVGEETNTIEGDSTTEQENLEEGSENRAKIESLTEEYVAPLLAVDFSDITGKPTDKAAKEVDNRPEDLTDDFDLESLLADAENDSIEQAISENDYDIGDDLAEGAFDESTISELLTDKATQQAVELSPDFSDQNVLADLLNDSNDEDSQVLEATEINDIQELDSLNFDELLANIEEESSAANQSADFNDKLDVGDDLSLSDFDNITSNVPPKTEENEQDFVSVDSLLSDSQYEVSQSEPYDRANIDVGLNEFPEFTDNVKQVDVDVDENGMAAKLDLAKVYIEIDDEDNAKMILQEVIKQGDTQQQVEAQSLLDNL